MLPCWLASDCQLTVSPGARIAPTGHIDPPGRGTPSSGHTIDDIVVAPYRQIEDTTFPKQTTAATNRH
eukprot:COSAG01_NODE_60657_length_293_cov_1.309278_1_plen_67_part_10